MIILVQELDPDDVRCDNAVVICRVFSSFSALNTFVEESMDELETSGSYAWQQWEHGDHVPRKEGKIRRIETVIYSYKVNWNEEPEESDRDF